MDFEVCEQHILNTAPATAASESGTLIRALWYKCADPRFDIRAIVHILVVSDYLDLIYPDISHARVLLVLAQTAYSNPISATTGDIVNIDIV